MAIIKISDEAREARRKYYREYNAKRRRNPYNVENDNEYMRAYRRKNPEKVKQYNIDYWERKALRIITDVTDKNSVTLASVTSVTGGKNCLECGKVFISKRPDAKFCSPACKQRHYRNEH